MKKFCAFCGKKPKSKNKEHILPKWLINITGDPNRKVYLGRKWDSSSLEKREFSLSSFTFPSCSVCNDKYSKFEAESKLVIEKILSKNAISSIEWDIFLDWIDKVRTGIWLGMIYLHENYRGLMPLFHIEKRISSKDRMLIIYEINDDEKGLSWSATESPIFQHMLSCFTFGINKFLFFSASYDFLFSKRFGFPYPKNISFRPEGGFYFEKLSATSKLKLPLIEKKFKTGGTQLFQPMIPWKHIQTEDRTDPEIVKIYNSAYVKENCLNLKNGKGKIFKRNRSKLNEYPITSSLEWIPKQKFSRGEIYHQVGILAGEFLEELFLKNISFGLLDKEQQKMRENEIDSTIRLHRTIINHFKNQKEIYY